MSKKVSPHHQGAYRRTLLSGTMTFIVGLGLLAQKEADWIVVSVLFGLSAISFSVSFLVKWKLDRENNSQSKTVELVVSPNDASQLYVFFGERKIAFQEEGDGKFLVDVNDYAQFEKEILAKFDLVKKVR